MHTAKENTHSYNYVIQLLRSVSLSGGNAMTSCSYLSLHLPELSLFGTVHLTVDDQNIWQTSNVARLHLPTDKWNVLPNCRIGRNRTINALRVNVSEKQLALTVGWYFSQFSHHAWVLCSRQMLFFKICANSYSFVFLSGDTNEKGIFPSCYKTHEAHDRKSDRLFTENYKLTLRVLFRVMHGEEQCEWGADCLLATATQTAVLHFTPKQSSDGRLTRGTQRAESSKQSKQTVITASLTLLMQNNVFRLRETHRYPVAADLLLAPL